MTPPATPAPVLAGQGILLRPPLPADIETRLDQGRWPEIYRQFGVDAASLGPLTRDRVAAWLDEIAASPTAWVIAGADDLFLGEIRLRDLNPADANARLGIALYHPGLLGRGLGRAAIRVLMPHAFGPLGLHRLSLRVLASNDRAIRCYTACGFVTEGRERESARVEGLWTDDLIMGCLAYEARLHD